MKRYINGIQKRVEHIQNRFKDVYHAIFANQKSPLNRYSNAFPHPQNALNIFQKDWRSRFPVPFQDLQAGETPLFEDLGVKWCIDLLGGVENKKVLELGPLEGGHTYLLHNAGAQSIVSIEAHPRAYLRCLIVKEILKLNRSEFLFGDFMEYLRQAPDQFELGLAVGVLYHMQQPVELLAKMAEKCNQLYVWTHYYDKNYCQTFLLKNRFSKTSVASYQGFEHKLYQYRYGSARKWSTFIGGPANTSHWLSKEDILNCCYHFGFKRIDINFEQVDHPHGPCFSFVARKN
jgi:hypothetical protein